MILTLKINDDSACQKAMQVGCRDVYKRLCLLALCFLLSTFGLSAKTIPVYDRNVVAGLSPYTWVRKEGCIGSSVNGASITVKFKGTKQLALLVETDHMQFESPNSFPIISWTVNGGEVQTHQIFDEEILISLSTNIQDPVIDLYVRGMSPMEDRFTGDFPPNSVKISGFIVDEDCSTVKVKPPKRHWLTIGDSILSGDGATLATNQGRPADDMWAASDDARASYGYLLASHFGFCESRLAYGGYDWGGGMAGTPALNLLIDSMSTTVSRLKLDKLNPIPDVVLINLGENGAPAEKDVVNALGKLRSRVSRETKVIVMVPVSGRARKEVTGAFNKYQALSADNSCYLVDLGFFGFATGDGQHPTAEGHRTIYNAALPAIDAILKGNYHSPLTMPLWTGNIPESTGRPAGENPVITVYRPAHPNGAAMVICPGGGYGMLVTGPEGQGIAQWLNRNGITGIVLEYRLPRGNQKIPLADASRTLRLVRSHAKEWNLDVEKIGIIGFSAGGHLASTALTHFDLGDQASVDPVARFSSRPDFGILIYPVITMGPKTHNGSKRNLLGPDPSEQSIEYFSNEKQATDNTPPTYLAHAQDDDVVSPDNSQMFYEAMEAHHVPGRYLKLPSGGHGLNSYSGPMWDEWQVGSLTWMAELGIIPPLRTASSGAR